MRYALILALLLPACSALVPSTLAELATLSPLDADPAEIEVALTLPEGLDIEPQGATLIFSADREGAEKTEEFLLERADALMLGGAIAAEPGGRLVLYRIARADLARIRAQQDLIRAWKARDETTRGSIGVALKPCVTGDGPSDDALGAVWLRAVAGGDFLPLVRPTALSRLYDAATLAAFPPCR